MTGRQHYEEAERLLLRAEVQASGDGLEISLAEAQVHATLAVAWATATENTTGYPL